MRDLKDDVKPSGTPLWLWIVAALLIVGMGSVLGWLVASQATSSEVPVEMAEAPLPPTRTPKPTFTALPASPTLEAVLPAPEASPTPSPEAPPVITPPANAALFVVQAETVPVYQGPAPTYPRLGEAPRHSTLLIAGRTPDGSWWLVCCVAEQSGWVALDGAALRVEGDVGLVDVITLPNQALPTFATPTAPPAPPPP